MDNRESLGRQINFKEFEALRRNGWVVEGSFPDDRSVVIFDGTSENSQEIPVEPQVMYSGIGEYRTAVTVFVPPQEIFEQVVNS